MDYEQKYKEAIHLFKELRPKISYYYRAKLDGLFPELAESEDEEDLIDILKQEFKEGDWIVSGNMVDQISSVREDCYIGYDTDGWYFALSRPKGNLTAHLWTIEDAKDGDVLVDVYGNIGIFEKRYGVNWHTYCYLGFEGCFISKSGSHSSICYPATKKQQDYLFQKISEAGCIWDDHAKMLICSTNIESND